MCVPLVTDKTIEEGELIVNAEGAGIKLTINNSDGQLVSENTYGYMADNIWSTREVEMYRLLEGGQLWKIDLKLEYKDDASSMAGPTIVAHNIGNFTSYEVLAMVKHITRDEYVVAHKEEQYGYIQSITFKAAPVIIEDGSFTPMDEERFSKAKEMANSLIS